MREISQEEKRYLLRLARESLIRCVVKRDSQILSFEEEWLEQRAGAFVTLENEGELKGCIGRIQASLPLGEVVQSMAMAAGTRDPRFSGVKPQEIETLEIEISILSPLREIQSIEEIQVGRDGLVISDGAMSGLLLPQVATDYGWDRETFLDHTCMKAGLAPDHWKNSPVKIEIFSAQVFSEKDFD